MNVLGVGAHYDDLELGCSGSLIKHVRRGDKVMMLVATDSGYRDPKGSLIRDCKIAVKEGKKAAEIIGAALKCLNYKTFHLSFNEELTKEISALIRKHKIDIIYSHWVHDLHRDHKNLANCTLMAGRHVPRFLMYRSNFYNTEENFRGNFYVDITDVMDKKIKVIKAHKSELERVRYDWLNFFIKQNENDGRIIGGKVKYAECFEIVRYLSSQDRKK